MLSGASIMRRGGNFLAQRINLFLTVINDLIRIDDIATIFRVRYFLFN